MWKDLAEKLEPLSDQDVEFLQTRKKELGQTTKFDALKCVRNAVWESVVRGVEWETAIQNQGWELRDGEIQKNGVNYKMDDLVDSEKLHQGLLYLQNVSTQVRAQAKAQAREQAKKKKLPATNFFRHQRPEDVLACAIIFPQFFVFMLALNLAIVVLSQNPKAETKNIYKETNAYVNQEIKKIQDEVVVKDGNATRPYSTSIPVTRGKDEGNRKSDERMGRNPHTEMQRGPNPNRGAGNITEKTEVQSGESAGAVGNGSTVGNDSIGADSIERLNSADNSKADVVAIKEWANVLSDLQLLGGDKMEKKEASKTVQYIQNQWDRQSAALGAPLYRVTCLNRLAPGGWNLGKGKGEDGKERFWTAEEIREKIPMLAKQNAQGKDIYITPIDPDHHYFLVDDMTAEGKTKLENSGLNPCLVQWSSENNFQGVIKTPRGTELSRKEEQSVANCFLKKLNCDFDGDKNISAPIHAFRLAGFRNKKKNRNGEQTKVIIASPRISEPATAALARVRNEEIDEIRRGREASMKVAASIKAVSSLLVEDDPFPEEETQIDKDFRAEWRRREGERLKKNEKDIDVSWNDFWAAYHLLHHKKYAKEEVAAAILRNSPEVLDRKRDPQAYATTTTFNAFRYEGFKTKETAAMEIGPWNFGRR